MNEKNLLSTLRHEMQYNFSRLQKQINGDEVETLNRGCEIPSWRDVKNYDESTYLGADDLKGCLILHNEAPEEDEVSSYSLILTGKGETRYVLPIDLAHMGVVE